MALSKLTRSTYSLNVFPRVLQQGSYFITEWQWIRRVPVQRAECLHLTNNRYYPDAPVLPLPLNVCEIFANETGRFTPERARDIATPILIYGNNRVASSSTTLAPVGAKVASKLIFLETNNTSNCLARQDDHIDSYDCTGAVSLNGSMQSNVPKPFCSMGRSTHFNMPGGQCAKDSKYIAEDMQKSHYRASINSSFATKLNKNGTLNNSILTSKLLQNTYGSHYISVIKYSTNSSNSQKAKSHEEVLTKQTEKLKILLQHYGRTVIVFHIAISLVSLGCIYMAVISGLDLTPLITKITGGSNEHLEKLMNTSSGFILAYTIHKIFAPVRLAITGTVTPFLVRYLRQIGILKVKK